MGMVGTADITAQRRGSALETEMRPIGGFLADPLVNEIMLNADGAIWIARAGHDLSRTSATMRAAQAETMLKTIAAIGRSPEETIQAGQSRTRSLAFENRYRLA